MFGLTVEKLFSLITNTEYFDRSRKSDLLMSDPSVVVVTHYVYEKNKSSSYPILKISEYVIFISNVVYKISYLCYDMKSAGYHFLQRLI